MRGASWFSGGLGESASTLWLLEPGAEPAALIPESASFDQKPRFSRDGAWIVFTRRPAKAAPGRIMRVRPDGGEPERVTRGEGGDEHSARPSPTRDEVAFISDARGSRDAYRVALDGGAPFALTHTPSRDELAPRWSPDGSYLALTVRPVGSPGGRGHPEARVVVLDRSGRVVLDVGRLDAGLDARLAVSSRAGMRLSGSVDCRGCRDSASCATRGSASRACSACWPSAASCSTTPS